MSNIMAKDMKIEAHGEVQPARLKLRLTSKGRGATVSAEFDGSILSTAFDGDYDAESIDEAVATMAQLALERLLQGRHTHEDAETQLGSDGL